MMNFITVQHAKSVAVLAIALLPVRSLHCKAHMK